jgi:hypothetical protein
MNIIVTMNLAIATSATIATNIITTTLLVLHQMPLPLFSICQLFSSQIIDHLVMRCIEHD